MSKSNRPLKSMPSARVVEVSQDDPDDEVVQRVAFRLVERTGKPILRALKLLVLVLLALMAVGAGVLYWLWPFE